MNSPTGTHITNLINSSLKEKSGDSPVYWEDFDYSTLSTILSTNKHVNKYKVEKISDAIITADTETSKTDIIEDENRVNIVVAWSICVRYDQETRALLYGRKPSDFPRCIDQIWANLPCHKIIVYFHNMSYDYTFLRKFMFEAWGEPDYQLNTKSHYPIIIDFGRVTFRDSLILAQRGIEKWANDLEVEHRKAVGKWDYNKMRDQDTELSADELLYISNDVLSQAECIDKTIFPRKPANAPLTSTGIVRTEMRKAGRGEGKRGFHRVSMTYDQQILSEFVYHGGYTHANRYILRDINPAICYDIASSYPNCLIAHKYPMEKFTWVESIDIDDLKRTAGNYAYMLEVRLTGIQLKNYGLNIPMPILQRSKCYDIQNPKNIINDNGRVLACDQVTIAITEIDFLLIIEQYDIQEIEFLQIWKARKEHLPRWFTEFVFNLFRDKTQLKGGDAVQYQIAKAMLNSCYGMCVQKPIKDEIIEDYDTGDYSRMIRSLAEAHEAYDEFLKNRKNILPYQWGIWVTAYAMQNLFELGDCVADDGTWLYCDTDSVYATKWNEEKLRAYNERKMKLIREAGFPDTVINEHDRKSYHLGIAELDGIYSEFKTLGSKRYCVRDAKSGKLKITVAGVPKNGADQLNNDINNFSRGFIFKGEQTGKLTHSYYFREKIDLIDGQEIGDSIDLTPCDYTLDETILATIDDINNDLSEEEVIFYG